MSKTIEVCEIFKSLQGESTHAGRICTFIRLSGCNLRCHYCDTAYAYSDGTVWNISDLVENVRGFDCRLVEITGGEPLLQPTTSYLCEQLISRGYSVLVETNGTFDISTLPSECIRIVDVKTPDSGESGSFLSQNVDRLNRWDEIKFVISSRGDFDWACVFVRKYELLSRCTIIFSPNSQCLGANRLAEWIIDTNLPVRMGIQLHKIIWGAEAKGK